MSDEVKVDEVATVESVAPKRTRKDYGIEDVEFIDSWQKADSAKQASELLTVISRKKGKIAEGEVVPKAIVLARAAVYRTKGVRLKKMERKNPRKLNVAELNKRINGGETQSV